MSRQQAAMAVGFLALALAGCAAAPDVKSDRLAWQTNLNAAIESSRQNRRPVLVLYSDATCRMCKQFDAKVLRNAAVIRKINDEFIAVHMDLTDAASPNQAVADRYGIRQLPTVKLYAPHGEEIGSMVGVPDRSSEIPARAFMQWLDQRVARMQAGGAS